MSKISKKTKELSLIGDHHTFLSRITKTLYYGKLPNSDRLSLPVTELATELFSEAQNGKSLERLHCNDAAAITRNACVSPCSFILAMLYLERLKCRNPEYLLRISPSELFLVSLMVSSKFLFDDGEEDEVFIDEWATSGGISVKELIQLEKEFLTAIEWEIFVNNVTFWKKLRYLESIIAKKEGSHRGWFTYTELETLLSSVNVEALMQYIAVLTAVLITTYIAGVLTIVSSVLIVSYFPGNCLQNTIDTKTNCTGLLLRQMETIEDRETDILTNLKEFRCDLKKQNALKRKIDLVDVLQTSLILGSIKPGSNEAESDVNKSFLDNKEFITWDWWSSSSMGWLTETSKLTQKLNFVPDFRQYTYIPYTDTTNFKLINLEDQVHRATRIRIQDQLERSWHKEWTDTIREVAKA